MKNIKTIKRSKQTTDLRVSMVMIVYNEKHHILDLVQEYYKNVFHLLPDGSEFLIYSDRPTDGTDILLNKIKRKYHFTLIRGKKNLGYALATKKILMLTKNPLVFYSDSSGKHEANDFWKLLPEIRTCDIVTGKRVSKGNPLVRSIISLIQQILVSIVFEVPMLDYNTGYKLLRRNVIRTTVPECKYLNQSFSSELLIRASRKDFSIKQVPVVFKKRRGKNTGTNYSNLPKIIYKQLIGYLKLFNELKVTT